jgi:hypothetical protein
MKRQNFIPNERNNKYKKSKDEFGNVTVVAVFSTV